jgi:diadenosine tetraphosphate (Ap4A) HIT family hydrolase
MKLYPDEKVIITDYFDAHQDWGVPIPGFFIIASRKGRISLDEFTDDEAADFFNLVRKLRKGMREILDIETVYLFQDEGTQHKLFHLWLFPRYDWMEKFGKKVESIRPIISYARESMNNEKTTKEVKEMVGKMKAYMAT